MHLRIRAEHPPRWELQLREHRTNGEQLDCAQVEIPPSTAPGVFSGLQNSFLVNDQVRALAEAAWSLAPPGI